MTLATRLERRTAAGTAGIDGVDRGLLCFMDNLRITGALLRPATGMIAHNERPSPTAFRTHA
jgi:hypothetical protein